MPEVQEEEVADSRGCEGAESGEREKVQQVMVPTDLIKLENGIPISGIRTNGKVSIVYRNGVNMAHFVGSAATHGPLGCQGTNEVEWAHYNVYDISTLWLATHTALGLLEGLSIPQLFGPAFYLFDGAHSAPEDPLPRIDRAVLVHIFDIDGGYELCNAVALAFTRYRTTGLN